MNAIKEIGNISLNKELLMEYISLYKEIGKNEVYLDTFLKDYDVFKEELIKKEAYFFYKTFFKIEINETRLLKLVDGAKPKDKKEELVNNILQIFSLIHDEKNLREFELTSNEILSLETILGKTLYPRQDLNFIRIQKSKSQIVKATIIDKRNELDDLIEDYKRIIKSHEYESNLANASFMIDLINMAPFKYLNEEIGILFFYVLSVTQEMTCYRYISFFEKLFKRKEEYQNRLKRSLLNAKEGVYSNPLLEVLLKMSKEAYIELKEKKRDYIFEKEQKKTDYIENTINKLPDIFTKEDIRKKHPLVSESTIDRTLKRLRDQDMIRAIGVGRNTKWMKLYESNDKYDFSSNQGKFNI